MGEGMYAHRYTHGGPPRPHLIVQCTYLGIVCYSDFVYIFCSFVADVHNSRMPYYKMELSFLRLLLSDSL
jgi:hypothetical protein